ncbi:hypothetical protein F4604DRAFT_1683576 [Suillus subluteus]|nr:hypothetical protein F4604DRAFT_1683576 [Suillus subluteus]
MSRTGPGVFNSGIIGTPRAIGALQTHRSPVLLHHLMTPSIMNYGFSANTVPASTKVSITVESDCGDIDDEDSNSSDIGCNEEFKAQLVLNAMQAQRDIHLAEKKLADCILKENAALGVLYEFKATEAERNLEDADMDIGYVHHSLLRHLLTLILS